MPKLFGLFQKHTDNCTYAYDDLYFVMTEEQMLSSVFVKKLEEMFPDIKEYEILKMIIEFETIETYDDVGYSIDICVQEVKTL